MNNLERKESKKKKTIRKTSRKKESSQMRIV